MTKHYDVVIAGGGVIGASCAYQLSKRKGLKVALIERDDWGAGTSQSSSKLIHGGLRYLEHYEFALVRHALAERRVLLDEPIKALGETTVPVRLHPEVTAHLRVNVVRA